jgi:hypothetical protein
VEDSVELAEVGAGGGNGGAHLVGAGDVSLVDDEAAGDGADKNKMADALAGGFIERSVVDRGFPLGFGRKGGTADKDEAGIEFASEMLGENETKAAETAGDEVDASGREALVLRQ